MESEQQLALNISKKLIVDFRRGKLGIHEPVFIDRMMVKRVNTFKFMGTNIFENVWSQNHSSLPVLPERVKLRKLKMNNYLFGATKIYVLD